MHDRRVSCLDVGCIGGLSKLRYWGLALGIALFDCAQGFAEGGDNALSVGSARKATNEAPGICAQILHLVQDSNLSKIALEPSQVSGIVSRFNVRTSTAKQITLVVDQTGVARFNLSLITDDQPSAALLLELARSIELIKVNEQVYVLEDMTGTPTMFDSPTAYELRDGTLNRVCKFADRPTYRVEEGSLPLCKGLAKRRPTERAHRDSLDVPMPLSDWVTRNVSFPHVLESLDLNGNKQYVVSGKFNSQDYDPLCPSRKIFVVKEVNGSYALSPLVKLPRCHNLSRLVDVKGQTLIQVQYLSYAEDFYALSEGEPKKVCHLDAHIKRIVEE